MKTLQGVVKKLSEVNKVRGEDGTLYILHCNCLRKGLWNKEYPTGVRFFGYHVCPRCALYTWMNKSDHERRPGRFEYLPAKKTK
jgi:hypothetical protein